MFFQLSRFDKSISVLQIFIRSIEDGCFGMVALLLISQKWCIRSHGRLRRQGKKTTRTGSLNWADTFDNDNIMPYQDLTRTQWLTNKNSNKKNRQAHHLLYMYGTEQKQLIKHLTFLQKKTKTWLHQVSWPPWVTRTTPWCDPWYPRPSCNENQ